MTVTAPVEEENAAEAALLVARALVEIQLTDTIGRDVFTRVEVQDNLLALHSALTVQGEESIE